MTQATISIDDRIQFLDDLEIMEADFSNFVFATSLDVNHFYDRLEARIAETGDDKWFFLVNLSGMRIDPSAWLVYAKRGKALNLAHSQGSVRFDASDETKRQIERDAKTERFDPNLFSNRDAALARIAEMPSKRRRKIVYDLSLTLDQIAERVRFLFDDQIMEADFSNLTFAHSGDVNAFYDFLEEAIKETGQKWYFLVNYESTNIYPEAWVSYAQRGKNLNADGSLGTVRFAPGSGTEELIRMRSEGQDSRPNIRNTRKEALERIAEMKSGQA